jgi:hypothetical protein
VAYPSAFVKVNIEGTFGPNATSVIERWSAGFHVGGPSLIAPDGTTLLAFLTAIAPTVSAYHTTASSLVGNSTWLQSLSAALIGTDGKYAAGSLQATTRYTYGVPVAGANASTGPYSQAIVWTLRSLILRGPASHGRLYYPSTAVAINSSTGTMTTAQATTIATSAKAVLDKVNTEASLRIGTGAGAFLVSPVLSGRQAPVTKVGIGLRLDAMESRERSLAENYQFANLVVSTALEAQAQEELRDALRDELGDAD